MIMCEESMKKYIRMTVILMLLLAGCGAKDEIVKYKITFNDSIFETEKSEYASGENVTVRYDIIATDTDYRFYSDDVDFKQDYDGGYVFTFIMPDHDVALNVESHNSMEYDPYAMGGDIPEVTDESRVSVIGPYGEISVMVPDNWSAEAVPVDGDKLMYGLYGLILQPEDADNGQIELFCSKTFGVCGTGLSTEEIILASVTAHVGTYDDHKHWDYIIFGDTDPQIVAQHKDCDSWSDEMWDEAELILDTMDFDRNKAEGDVIQTYEVTEPELSEQYISEGRLVTLVQYYELSDGTWKTDDNEYKYRLEITGRMGGAAKDSTFVYLSNIEDISFQRAYMAAGLSSNMDDYFDPKEAVLVAMN